MQLVRKHHILTEFYGFIKVYLQIRFLHLLIQGQRQYELLFIHFSRLKLVHMLDQSSFFLLLNFSSFQSNLFYANFYSKTLLIRHCIFSQYEHTHLNHITKQYNLSFTSLGHLVQEFSNHILHLQVLSFR